MIFVYHQKEFLLLVAQSFLCGVILGAVYDVFRITRLILGFSSYASVNAGILYQREYPLVGRLRAGARKRKKGEAVVIFFQDILFMLIATAMLLVLLFFRNDGKFRFIVIVIAMLGFVCYYISIGRLVIRFSEFIVFALRLIFAYVVFVSLLPIKCVVKCLKNAARAVYSFFARIYARSRLSSDSQEYKREVLAKAHNGFIVFKNNAKENHIKMFIIKKRRNKKCLK